MKLITLYEAKKRVKKAQETYLFMCQQLNDPPKTDIIGNALRRVMNQLTLNEAKQLQQWFDMRITNPFK